MNKIGLSVIAVMTVSSYSKDKENGSLTTTYKGVNKSLKSGLNNEE